MRCCKTCKENKDEAEFYRNSDGYLFPECKKCNTARTRAWQERNKDKKNENGRKYYHRRREVLLSRRKKARDREEYGGNRYLVLERDNYSCLGCGITQEQHLEEFGEELHAHHIDRDRNNNEMLNIRTLCARCHGKEHSKEGSASWFKKGNIPHNKKAS